MNKKSLLVLAASGLLTIGMASCGGQQPGSSAPASSEPTSIPSVEPSSEPSSASKVVSKIAKTTLPKFAVGEEIDLDDYITVQYADKTEDKDYTITVTDEDLSVNGHKLIPVAVKSYTVNVKAGNKSSRVTIDVRSEANIAIAKFLAPLAQTPQNYTMEVYGGFNSDYSLKYGFTAMHNENYFAEYDKSSFPGENIIIEKLSNGKAYWGEFDSEGNPVFEAGSVDFDGYYITGDLSVDGYSFSSTFTEDEETGEMEEELSAPASVTNALLNYGLSNFPEKDGCTVEETVYLGGIDYDDDGEADELIFAPMVSDSTGKKGFWCLIGIHDIGTSKLDILEEAHTDSKYLPETITAPEIVTAFESALAATSYTVNVSAYASDKDGAALEGDEATASLFNMMFGCTSFQSILTYDAQGIEGAFAENGELAAQMALFNRDGQGYQVSWDEGVSTTEAIEGVTDVLALDYTQGWLPQVTADDVNNTEWTGKTVNDDGVTFVGNVGDNNGTERGNKLFEKVFDTLGWFDFGGKKVGTYLTQAEEFSAGNSHALTLYSNWAQVSTSADGITCAAIVYLPFSNDGGKYCTFVFELTDIGTTVNDFSGYQPAAADSSEA